MFTKINMNTLTGKRKKSLFILKIKVGDDSYKYKIQNRHFYSTNSTASYHWHLRTTVIYQSQE